MYPLLGQYLLISHCLLLGQMSYHQSLGHPVFLLQEQCSLLGHYPVLDQMPYR